MAINCASRLPFALSKQDLAEGIVQWSLGQPYWIAQDGDGYCCHLHRNEYGCTIYEHRPLACRGVDCRQDTHIWSEFDRMCVNPDIYREDWPQGLMQAMSQEGDGTRP